MKDEKIENIDSLEETIVFSVDEIKKADENSNIIREKDEIIDFTEPVNVIGDLETDKKKTKKTKVKNKKNKKENIFSKLKNLWKSFSKKKKIIILVITTLLVILAVLLVLVLLKDDKDVKEKIPNVVIEQDNYRYQNGTLVFLDEQKNEIGKYKCENKDEKKCYVAYLSNEDEFTGDLYLDEAGNKKVLRSRIINNDYVFIVDNKKQDDQTALLYSIKTSSKFDKYKLVKQNNINKTVAVVKDESGKYGILDLSSQNPSNLVNFNYGYIGLIENEAASKYIVVNKNDKFYVADYTENILSSGFTSNIAEYNDNFIVTKLSDGKYEIYDYEGNKLQTSSAIFIKLYNEYYAFLQDNGITVFDKEGVKYNENPIGLSTTNYNRTYVFDANDQIISNDVAFEITQSDESISITRGKTIDYLSIKEAKANQEHAFMSYYNGILYFYQDPAKTTLIGKYTCKNRNTSGAFDNCTIASSSSLSNNDLSKNTPSGKLALINNRYVFIKDTLSTGGIYLYDLSQSKRLGPYIEVDSDTLVDENESVKTTDGAYIIVKNNKNLNGLLKITSSSVDTIIPIENSSIERAKDYFLVKKSSGTYALYNNGGTKITGDFGGKIQNYNSEYVTISQSNKYQIFKYDTSKVDDNTYDYIKLEKDYYIAFRNNNLEIHTYKNPGVNVLQSDVKIKYPESFVNSSVFSVSASQLGYIVKITDGANDFEYAFDKNGKLSVEAPKEETPNLNEGE